MACAKETAANSQIVHSGGGTSNGFLEEDASELEKVVRTQGFIFRATKSLSLLVSD